MAEKLASLKKKGGNVTEGSYIMQSISNNPQSVTLPFAPKSLVGYVTASGTYESVIYDADSGDACLMYGVMGTSNAGITNQISVSGNTLSLWSVSNALVGKEFKYFITK